MNNEGYIKIRRGLYSHLEDGSMTGQELSVYLAIHFYADYRTGLATKISAPFIARFLSEKNIQMVQRCLRNLEKKAYVKRFNHRGQRTYYPVLINKFETPQGLIIRADKTLSLNEIVIQDKLNLISNESQINFKLISNEFKMMPIKEVKKLISIKNKNNKNEKNVKNKYLDSVLLSDEEYRILGEKLGDINRKKYIENLDCYIGSKGKKYKSHYKTILAWWHKDGDPVAGKNLEYKGAKPTCEDVIK